MSRPSLQWYANRIRGMSVDEAVWRARDHVRIVRWARRQVLPGEWHSDVAAVPAPRAFPVVLPAGVLAAVPGAAAEALVAAADELLRGRREVLGVERCDLVSPDWFVDPITGRRSRPDRYAFRINHRSERETGNIKQVWELSRHQHLTVLSAAWFLTRRDAYAERVAAQLGSWWQENPFLSGVHWTSGIELGVRLISWTWIRRLLDEWPGVRELFDENHVALQQIRWHQEYLAAFRSRGSSANNHVVAEAAGQLTAACAFPWFLESDRWRSQATRLLERSLEDNTFESGVNRELASDYHGFVAELGLLAAVEAAAAGSPVSAGTWQRLCRMLDSAAGLVDSTCRPPRQGDGDDGQALGLSPNGHNDWSSLLALGRVLFGSLPWWPHVPSDVMSVLVGSLMPSRPTVEARPSVRPSFFPDAGVTILRTQPADSPEIWCRCDGGPHGFLSIAAHAHADALSIEVRHEGVDILADPGTYCYHGDPSWRSYFRSTLGHNTVEIAGRDQSLEGGPFLWVKHADARTLKVDVDGAGELMWQGDHDGYASLESPAYHRRTVRLDQGKRELHIMDEVRIDGCQAIRTAFHLGPEVAVDLKGSLAHLTWDVGEHSAEATMELAPELQWTVHRGEIDPPLGWYSPGFGSKLPTSVLLGTATSSRVEELVTTLRFLDM